MATDRWISINSHLKRSLDLLADRKTPDYRNSIKEAISAFEALCRIIVGDDSLELGRAVDALTRKGVQIHGAVKNGLKNIYGYTSDVSDIRHALKDAPTVDFEDAKFMLVMCSGFVNYLIAKASKVGAL